MKMWEGADGSTESHDEKRWKRWWNEELVERIDHVLLHLHTHSFVQEGEFVVVPGAKHEDIRPRQLAILKLQGAVFQDFGHGGRLPHPWRKRALQALLPVAQHHLWVNNRGAYY